ncbi:YdcF family protein [Psychrobacter sp. APC 3426]|uniref:YdcF family protein n=1 Tax=Psychrobacter sp. APC 3426 TaxID=3035177 RepID=UPI0025B446DD|nr:YdcF family protein [Psychrobacter sp. APC 3426]MDN3397878.1 YdcF family protein [Psychrobacter sp. APC 3426]
MSKTLLIRILLLIVGIIITIDCAVLMIIGKINFGSVVPFIIGVIFVIHGIYWERIRRFIRHHPLFKRVWYGLWGLFILWLISFMVFVWSLQQQIERSQQPAPTVAAIIVLGSGTVAGKPTPTLAKRLDTAAPLIDAQPNAIVITSGGVGFQRSRSEADIMASYLHETHRIPFERILQEGKSTSTEENLANSQALLAAQGVSITDPIAIVTSDFHTIRAARIARHQGYTHSITIASPTPLSIRYNAWFREYFAFVSGWLFGEY